MIKCLSQKTTKMNNKKICTNWKKCSYITDCPHNRIHEHTKHCDSTCNLTDEYQYPKCESINFIRKQKLEKLNQIYEV